MKKVIVLVIGSAILLSACTPCCVAVREAQPAQVAFQSQNVFQSQKVLAVGYGAMGGNFSQYTVGQQKLMAMRAARIDAYRNLAEHVNGFRVWGNTAVSAFATQNDSVRSYVDSFIRGARVVNSTPIADGNFEVTVELELTPSFFSCLTNASTCGMPVAVQRDNTCSTPSCVQTIPVAIQRETVCATSGCVQPSAYYYTTP